MLHEVVAAATVKLSGQTPHYSAARGISDVSIEPSIDQGSHVYDTCNNYSALAAQWRVNYRHCLAL